MNNGYAVQDTLAPGSTFVAYQYSKIMKAHFESRFAEIRTSFVPINVPPAFVYECCGDRRGAATTRWPLVLASHSVSR